MEDVPKKSKVASADLYHQRLEVLIHGDFHIFDIDMLFKYGLVAAEGFITATKSGDFRLVIHKVWEEEGPN